ncbi:DUF1330 domain-containing protein [Defluviimonas salinarum]|uniref:DUF1330 domain-containing protein n=1 Tax=Defluviimonas salinarum TaxID=2992147 RepID=A0ABT3J4T0_9RHOB|nr:DUF1330 domain-containing protein [Defluviimonas salinarum]MCW3782686.1 DUF1330 domain-containing protein [Defluviimonas salinarum]
MSTYMIAQIDIRDPAEYQKYLDGFLPVFERHGGRLLVTSRVETEVLEGAWAHPRTVVMAFPDTARARAWYADPDYRRLKKHRLASAEANLVLVEGIG